MTEDARAPSITLTAVESGRKFAFDRVTVPTLVLAFANETSSAIDPIIPAVREVYPTADDAEIANLVDLHSFPRLLRKVPEMLMSNRYKQAAQDLEPGRDPARYLIVLPDWDASAIKAFGFEGVEKELALAVIAPGGRVVGTYQGPEPNGEALRLLTLAAGG